MMVYGMHDEGSSEVSEPPGFATDHGCILLASFPHATARRLYATSLCEEITEIDMSSC